jgi:hypothetical protein
MCMLASTVVSVHGGATSVITVGYYVASAAVWVEGDEWDSPRIL